MRTPTVGMANAVTPAAARNPAGYSTSTVPTASESTPPEGK